MNILFNTRNKFHISVQPCNILYVYVYVHVGVVAIRTLTTPQGFGEKWDKQRLQQPEKTFITNFKDKPLSGTNILTISKQFLLPKVSDDGFLGSCSLCFTSYVFKTLVNCQSSNRYHAHKSFVPNASCFPASQTIDKRRRPIRLWMQFHLHLNGVWELIQKKTRHSLKFLPS